MTGDTEVKKPHMRVIKEEGATEKTAESIRHHRGKRSIILIEKDLFKHGSLAFVGFKIIKQGAQITCRSVYTTFNFRLIHLHVIPSKRFVGDADYHRLNERSFDSSGKKKPKKPNNKLT